MQNHELLAAEWDHPRITEIIEKLAHLFASMYPGSYEDEDDLVQIGRMTAWESAQKWRPEKGSYLTYARRSTFNEIRRTAIKANYALSGSYDQKVLASKIRARLRAGQSPSTVRSVLGISEDKWRELLILVSRGIPLRQFIEEKGKNEDPYSVLQDILAIKELTDDERRIIVSRVYGTTQKLGIPATSLQRKLVVIHQKVARGGYGNGS